MPVHAHGGHGESRNHNQKETEMKQELAVKLTAEREENLAKIKKLTNFLVGANLEVVGLRQGRLLFKQLDAMNTLDGILSDRIYDLTDPVQEV